jgi:hypothetical protein
MYTKSMGYSHYSRQLAKCTVVMSTRRADALGAAVAVCCVVANWLVGGLVGQPYFAASLETGPDQTSLRGRDQSHRNGERAQCLLVSARFAHLIICARATDPPLCIRYSVPSAV